MPKTAAAPANVILKIRPAQPPLNVALNSPKKEKPAQPPRLSKRIMCRHCKKTYTLEPKRNAYSEETRALALKIYYSGASGRGVGKVLSMSKS